ncbi:MAG TPA: hypothetical protein VFO39_09395 [Candidatus Sulfotelmatobacter sp.]|nr:hypothetical protein [Candidatus Sulfotelmatobacter sp.]
MGFLRIAVVNVCLGAALSAAPTSVQVLEYDFQGATIAAEQGKSRRTVIVEGHARVHGNQIRIDLDPSGTATSHMADYYMLGLEDGKKIQWINPYARQFYEVFAEVGDAGLILAPSSGDLVPEMRNIRISVDKLQDSTELLGHPTIHYRYSQSLDVLSERSHTIHNRFTADYFFPADIPNFVNPLLFRAVYSAPEKVPDEYGNLVRSEVGKLPKLAPLRSIYLDVNEDATTKETSTESTTFEVTGLHIGTATTGEFEVPAGFKRIDRPRLPLIKPKVSD